MDGVVVKCVTTGCEAVKGSAGIQSQVPGGMVTVSNVSEVTGGMSSGKVTERDVK